MVILSWCLVSVCLVSVMSRYCSKLRWDRDFGFLPRVFSILRQNFMSLGEGGPHKWEGERGTSPSKRRYFTVIGSFNVKMVADKHRHSSYRNKHCRQAS